MSFKPWLQLQFAGISVTRGGFVVKPVKLVLRDTDKGHSYCVCIVVCCCKICKSKLLWYSRS